jgi:hypothetical protein
LSSFSVPHTGSAIKRSADNIIVGSSPLEVCMKQKLYQRRERERREKTGEGEGRGDKREEGGREKGRGEKGDKHHHTCNRLSMSFTNSQNPRVEIGSTNSDNSFP